MKVKVFPNFSVSREIRDYARELTLFLGDKWNSQSLDPSSHTLYTGALKNYFPSVLDALSGNMNGKAVLDLGCGSNNTPFGYEPWLCRILSEVSQYHRFRTRVIGVDHGDLSGEMFETHQIDLTTENLPFGNNTVNVATAFNLYDSPDLQNVCGTKRSLENQLKKIIVPKGVFIYSPV
jgi:SAM-dependent methyltransferase